MALTYGAYTACLQDRSLEAALDILAANSLTGAEVNVDGFIPAPHCHVDLLLADAAARAAYLARFADRGMRLTGLNASGNPLSPLPGVGPKHAHDLRQAIRLAGALGVAEVVAMSGTPGSDPKAEYPCWVVNPWNGVDLDILDYQWSVLIPFWQGIDQLARDNDVVVCLELHPANVLFSPVTFRQLVDRAGVTNVAVNLDPSHLFWQQMDPIASIDYLGRHVRHVHAKDTKMFPGAAIRGVLDTTFTRVPTDAPGKVSTGYGFWRSAWPQDPAWRFVALGAGHDVDYWADFLRACAAVDPDMHINIEHEDADYGPVDGLARSAKTLLAAAERAGL